MPHDMGLRVTVQQQDRWPVAAVDQVYDCFRSLDLSPGEAFEHGWPLVPVAALVLLAAAAGALLVSADLASFGTHRALLVTPRAGAGGRVLGMPVGTCCH